jgi:hypothetical protein
MLLIVFVASKVDPDSSKVQNVVEVLLCQWFALPLKVFSLGLQSMFFIEAP